MLATLLAFVSDEAVWLTQALLKVPSVLKYSHAQGRAGEILNTDVQIPSCLWPYRQHLGLEVYVWKTLFRFGKWNEIGMPGLRDRSCTSCVCASSRTSQPSVAIPLILSCAFLSSALLEHILLGILRHFCLYGYGGHYCIPSLMRCQKSIIALFAHLGKFRSV